MKVTTSYKVEDESDGADENVRAMLIQGLSNLTGKSFITDDEDVSADQFAISSSEKVGATIADDIKNAFKGFAVPSLESQVEVVEEYADQAGEMPGAAGFSVNLYPVDWIVDPMEQGKTLINDVIKTSTGVNVRKRSFAFADVDR